MFEEDYSWLCKSGKHIFFKKVESDGIIAEIDFNAQTAKEILVF